VPVKVKQGNNKLLADTTKTNYTNNIKREVNDMRMNDSETTMR
jgi:hypothetical protein